MLTVSAYNGFAISGKRNAWNKIKVAVNVRYSFDTRRKDSNMSVRNSEGYLDPTVDTAFRNLYHTAGRLDYTKFKSYEELIVYTMRCHSKIKTRAAAEVYIRESMPKESYFQKRIIDWINQNVPNCIVWKEAVGPYSRQGIPDITCIVGGRYYGFEVKRPFIGKLSKVQKQTIKEIRDAGGRAYVVTGIEDVKNVLMTEIAKRE